MEIEMNPDWVGRLVHRNTSKAVAFHHKEEAERMIAELVKNGILKEVTHHRLHTFLGSPG